MTPEFIATATLAKRFGRSPQTVRRWADKLGIAVYRNAGGDYMVRTDDAHMLDPKPVATRATPKPAMMPVPKSETQLREELRRLTRGTR